MKYFNYVAGLALLTGAVILSACSRQDSSNNGGQAEDRQRLACVVATDFYMVHFTAYLEPTQEEMQDRKKAFSPYCQDLPRTGKAYLTVDMLDADVKSIPISAKVSARKNDQLEDILVLPAKAYPTGIIELAANLTEAGEYLVELGIGRTVAKDDTIRIPVRVALQPPLTQKLGKIGAVFAAIMAMVGAVVFGHRYWRSQRVQTSA